MEECAANTNQVGEMSSAVPAIVPPDHERCLHRGAPRKYLDSLLSASRLELFRPGVDLLAAGDAVNELFIVVAGRVELR
jgi:hypothetical protein